MGVWGDMGISTVIAVGRHLPQHMQTELSPSQDLQQSRGDLFQCPQGTRQGPREPEPAPAEPHLPIWPVCLSICSAWLLVMGQFAGAGGSQIVLGGGAGSMTGRLGGCTPSHCWISEQNHQHCPGCCTLPVAAPQ